MGEATTTTAYTDLVNPTLLTHATGERDEVSFDSMGRVETLIHRPSPGGAPTLHRELAYTPGGDLDTVTDLLAPGAPAIADYGYDPQHRLTSETRTHAGEATTTTWGYDAQGNRTTQTRGGVTTTYGYSASGQLLSAQEGASGPRTAFFYDPVGNLTRRLGPSGETTYAWDPSGMLEAITPSEGEAVSFSTDALGQRVTKTAGGTTTTYTWEKGRLSKTTGANAATFAYDELGKPLSMTLSGDTYVYRTDERGSVIELTDAETNLPAATYRYDAWGAVLEATGDEALLAANPFTWLGAHGVLSDQETGLYQMGARTYDPGIGRFLSSDPVAADPSESPYVYAGNNPTTLMDPTGLFSEGSRFSNYYRYRPRPKPTPPRPKPRPSYNSYSSSREGGTYRKVTHTRRASDPGRSIRSYGKYGRSSAALTYIHAQMRKNASSAFIRNAKHHKGVARGLWLTAFAGKLRQGGEWDHKPYLQRTLGFRLRDHHSPLRGSKFEHRYDMWSNIHYGYVGRAAGLSKRGLLKANRLVGRNDAADGVSIRIGMRLWEKHGLSLTRTQMRKEILGWKWDYYISMLRDNNRFFQKRRQGNGY